MPHPDYQIVDVPLRVDQVADLMGLIDDAVATGQAKPSYWAGIYAGLMGAIPKDAPYLRPGQQHWVYQELGVTRR